MKIALLTWFHFRNYGTALQVYATYHFLSTLGYDVDVVDYTPTVQSKYLIANYGASDIISRFFSRYRIVNKFNDFEDPQNIQFCNEEKNSVFSSFLNEKLTFTEKCTSSLDLRTLNEKYDAFICGSDQIWSPLCFDSHYFLDFVLNNNKIISYAPSLGVFDISDKYKKEQIRKLISRFSHLSVRENHGKHLIKSLTGKDAQWVCDPTMLLSGDEWRMCCNVKKNTHVRPYLLVYMLGYNDQHWKHVAAYATENGLDIKVIPVFEKDLSLASCIHTPIDPSEFVSLIDNSDMVCTDSFHGMVFSLLLKKDFIPYERFESDDPSNQNSRIYSLLDMLNLSDRLIHYSPQDTYTFKPLDYTIIESLITDFRKSSSKYLSNAVNTVSTQKSAQNNHIISNSVFCCGCGVCEIICPNSAIKTKLNDNGFIRTYIDDQKCINCGKCINICPMLSKSPIISSNNLAVYKNTSTNLDIMCLLARLLLNEDYLIAGCKFDPISQHAKHSLLTSPDQLGLLRNAKYMQSDFSSVLYDIQSCSSPVAIFGTPCQIAGARKLFSNRTDVLYIDFDCCGIPTNNVYKKYLEYLSAKYSLKKDRISSVFDYQKENQQYRYVYSTDGEKSVCIESDKDLYCRLYNAKNCFAESCYECHFADHSYADIRITNNIDSNENEGFIILNEDAPKIIQLLKDDHFSISNNAPTKQVQHKTKPLYHDEILSRLCTDELDLIAHKYTLQTEQLSLKERLCTAIRMYQSDRAYRRRIK